MKTRLAALVITEISSGAMDYIFEILLYTSANTTTSDRIYIFFFAQETGLQAPCIMCDKVKDVP